MPDSAEVDFVAGADPTLGERIRGVRTAAMMTLADLAEKTGLTQSFISRIERDKANATVSTLLKLCAALEIEVASLFDDHDMDDVVTIASRKAVEFGGERLKEFLLTSSREARVQVLYSVIEPGGGSGDDPYSLPTDFGFVFVVQGQLRVHVRDRDYILEERESLSYSPNALHSFYNDTKSPTEVLWVMYPALPRGDRKWRE